MLQVADKPYRFGYATLTTHLPRRTFLHLGPNVITFSTLLHLGQLLHLGLQGLVNHLGRTP